MFSSKPRFPEWSFEQVKAFSQAPPPGVHLIDVREAAELHSAGSIPNALNVPLSALPAFLSAQLKEKEGELLVFTCARGGRAERAAEEAQGRGFSRVAVYYGSYTDWAQKMRQ